MLAEFIGADIVKGSEIESQNYLEGCSHFPNNHLLLICTTDSETM
jgi:hypothetical protein